MTESHSRAKRKEKEKTPPFHEFGTTPVIPPVFYLCLGPDVVGMTWSEDLAGIFLAFLAAKIARLSAL